MVKGNLFIADTQSYVPLELNRIARNVHLFKLTKEAEQYNQWVNKECKVVHIFIKSK